MPCFAIWFCHIYSGAQAVAVNVTAQALQFPVVSSGLAKSALVLELYHLIKMHLCSKMHRCCKALRCLFALSSGFANPTVMLAGISVCPVGGTAQNTILTLAGCPIPVFCQTDGKAYLNLLQGDRINYS